MPTAFEQAIDSLTKENLKNCLEDWFIWMHKRIDAEGQYVLWKNKFKSSSEYLSYKLMRKLLQCPTYLTRGAEDYVV